MRKNLKKPHEKGTVQEQKSVFKSTVFINNNILQIFIIIIGKEGDNSLIVMQKDKVSKKINRRILMKKFTLAEKERILELLMQLPEEKRKTFIDELSRNLDALCSLRTLKGGLTGLAMGIIWDFIPGTEWTTGLSDASIKWFATAVGGYLGYREEKKQLDELEAIHSKILSQHNN